MNKIVLMQNLIQSRSVARFVHASSRLILIMSLILLSTTSVAASISAKVNRNSIAMSETLTFTVWVDEQVAFSSPSFE